MRKPSTLRFHSSLVPVLEQLNQLGRDVIATHADDVDRDARFPVEAMNVLKELHLLGAYVPAELGGRSFSVADLTKICEVLGGFCASTAMIFAMHQIQVAILVHHTQSSESFRDYLSELAAHQYLLASATSEIGTGGEVRSSICALEEDGDRVRLEKQAPVISYGEHADAILVTCRRSAEASPNDQALLLARRRDLSLQRLSEWDTLGFRGTCSNGFTLKANCPRTQVAPVPYAEIHSKTMHPFAHSVWASLWLGIATSAVAKARNFVRAETRKDPNSTPPSALRLAELDAQLFAMRGSIHQQVSEYESLLEENPPHAFTDFGFTTRTVNLKITASQMVVDIVNKALLICGINGYRNDSKFSLGRQLRDAYGAALMVNNDRILRQSASMQILV